MISTSGCRSVIVIALESSTRGRSIGDNRVTAGKPRIVDSPAIVPESDRNQQPPMPTSQISVEDHALRPRGPPNGLLQESG